MFKGNQILERLEVLESEIERLHCRLTTFNERFDDFIIIQRQTSGQLASSESKILAEENAAYKVGYEKGYRDARQHDLLINSLGKEEK